MVSIERFSEETMSVRIHCLIPAVLHIVRNVTRWSCIQELFLSCRVLLASNREAMRVWRSVNCVISMDMLVITRTRANKAEKDDRNNIRDKIDHWSSKLFNEKWLEIMENKKKIEENPYKFVNDYDSNVKCRRDRIKNRITRGNQAKFTAILAEKCTIRSSQPRKCYKCHE